MVNRTSLLQAIEPLIDPSPTQREAIRKSLDKALVEATLALPVTAAQALPAAKRAELEIVLRDFLTLGEAIKLSGQWEPQRALDAETKQNAKRDLIELLHGRRPRYEALKIVSLEEARSLPDSLRLAIQTLAPTKDLKRLLKSWDRHLKPIPTARKELSDRLLVLLGGGAPSERANTPRPRRAA